MAEAQDTAIKTFDFVAADEAATLRLAAWMAAALPVPSLVFLKGDLGAGKTAFARGFIRALHGQATQVPSPTFTLVQPYEEQPPIMHADLYRLAAPEEIDELGISDALADHICLIEWAEKAGDLLPLPDCIISLTVDDNETRRIVITGKNELMDTLIDALKAHATRDTALQGFLNDTDWHDALRGPLAGDASTRRYERLAKSDSHDGALNHRAVLMDWAAAPDGPPVYNGKAYSQLAHLAEAMPRFADMVEWLRAHDLPAPQLYAVDRAQGFALLEDFGDRTIAADVSVDRNVFYHEAVDNLLHLHGLQPAEFLPPYDGQVQAIEASLFIDWYLPYIGVTVDAAAKADWMTLWQKAGDAMMADGPVTVLRDYHSVNLIWRDDAQARYRTGLIDVQDALRGHAAYDLASLIYDARIDVAAHHQARMQEHYMTTRFGDDAAARDKFLSAFAQCAVQRNLKIAGIFIRLAMRDGKPAYLRHMPRILGYIRRHINHPALAGMADWLATHAPNALEPSDD